jgi:non-heme Fe2+,alpha-ketoglutarate-dependent halogenase
MTHLTKNQIEDFERDGFLSPLDLFSCDEAVALRASLEAIEREFADRNLLSVRSGLPITTAWAWDLVHDARIVDPVSDLLGPDVLLWSMDWFIKEPGSTYVSYHQDATYWGLEPHDVVTAWVALSDAGPATGPMKFLPASHRGPIYDQEDTFAEGNLLSRGQTIRGAIDESTAVLAPLATGQMSLHHVRVVHASDPNTTDDRRIGMVLRYCGCHVRQTKVDGDRAILVRGRDTHGHFEMIPRPRVDRGEAELALLREYGRTRHRALHSKDYLQDESQDPRQGHSQGQSQEHSQGHHSQDQSQDQSQQ